VVHLRSRLDARDLAVPEDVSQVRDGLGAEGDEEPDRVDVLQAIPDALEPGGLAQCEEGRQSEGRGGDEEDGGLCPRPVEFASRLDVQVTQVRILR
jgi:hypothetical protein